MKLKIILQSKSCFELKLKTTSAFLTTQFDLIHYSVNVTQSATLVSTITYYSLKKEMKCIRNLRGNRIHNFSTQRLNRNETCLFNSLTSSVHVQYRANGESIKEK